MKTSTAVLLLSVSQTLGFIAYDCSDNRTAIKAFNNLYVMPCDLPNVKIDVVPVPNAILLQKPEKLTLPYKSCLITADYSISESTNGILGDKKYVESVVYSEFIELGYERCFQLHKKLEFQLPSSISTTSKLVLNGRKEVRHLLAGSCEINGTCNGVNFTSQYGSWTDAVVWVKYTIEITEGIAQTNYVDNVLILPTGITLPIYNNYGLDPSRGEIIWNANHFECNRNYNVLYTGMAKIVRSMKKSEVIETYLFETSTEVFALRVFTKSDSCNIPILRTEHPQLFIIREIEYSASLFALDDLKLKPFDTDLIAYANSKFVSIKSFIGNNDHDSYSKLVQKKCNIEREMLLGRLSIASYSLLEFAYAVGEGPGYMAISRGQIIYLLKCVAVLVNVYQHNKCFNELPVTFRNATLYMHPKTRILQKYGTETLCNTSFPAAFSINKNWFIVSPYVNNTETPKMLTLNETFVNVSPIASTLAREIDNVQTKQTTLSQQLQVFNLSDFTKGHLLSYTNQPRDSYEHYWTYFNIVFGLLVFCSVISIVVRHFISNIKNTKYHLEKLITRETRV